MLFIIGKIAAPNEPLNPHESTIDNEIKLSSSQDTTILKMSDTSIVVSNSSQNELDTPFQVLDSNIVSDIAINEDEVDTNNYPKDSRITESPSTNYKTTESDLNMNSNDLEISTPTSYSTSINTYQTNYSTPVSFYSNNRNSYYSTNTNPNHVLVEGYQKSNGKYVEQHIRTAPNSTILDNFSTYPNHNPYTGQIGTRRK